MAQAHGRRGFTLVELIIVLVLVGVLAVVAGPKVFDVSGFQARGFHDQTMSYLRFAQKTAIAQRRTVCVAFGTNTVSLSMAASAGTTNCTTAAALTVPLGQVDGVLRAPSGIAYDATWAPVDFNFDSQGQPITSAGAAQSRQKAMVAGESRYFYIESVTGYVHD